MVERDEDRPAPPPDDDDPDAPASAEEIAASQRLRDALAGTDLRALDEALAPRASPELELALALRAAWDPATLSENESRAVLDVTPTAEEQRAAAALRDALADHRAPTTGDVALQLAHALRAAFAPAALADAAHRRIVEAALERLPAGTGKVLELRRRQTVVRVAFGAIGAGLALAASITLVVTQSPPHEAPLARARTTQPLFSEPFKAGETSARIDRIASARASDFRDNRFSKWGVR